MTESMTTPLSTQPVQAAGAPRQAGWREAIVLLLASCLSVLGAVLLAPVLPRLQDAFAGTPGVNVLVPITLTVPALMIGLLAPFAGRIVDAAGRRRLLIGALVVYAGVGTAPLWLNSLPLIVVSRVGVGITEAAIMTACTTLLADYFSGTRRARILGLQVVFTSVAATIFFGLGGALGNHSWRTPFWLYASSLVLAAAAALVIWQPEPDAQRQAERRAELGQGLPPIPWQQLRTPVAVSLFGGVVFYALIVELSFVLDGLGVTAPASIGQATAAASVATAAGAVAFGWAVRIGLRVLLPICFGLAGIGLVVVGFVHAVPGVLVGAVITSFGNGLLLPALLTWALSRLEFEQRGRGTGLWTGSLFVGQFVCPILLLAVEQFVGGLTTALAALGVAALAMTLALSTVLRPALDAAASVPAEA
jgi:MFS family permease